MQDDILQTFAKEAREDGLRYRKEADECIQKMEDSASKLDEDSVKNYAAWRDYLHKYYTLILAFIAGTGIVSSAKGFSDYKISYGILFALIGIMIGFIGINIYFYLERKWFQAQNMMKGDGYYSLQKHPDVMGGDIIKSIRLHLKDKLKIILNDLRIAKKEGEYKKVKSIKQSIRARKEEIFILNFVGQQFSLIQLIWISFVVSSFVLTAWGVILIFSSVIKL